MFHSFMQHLCLFWICSPFLWVCLQIKRGIWKEDIIFLYWTCALLRLVWFVHLTRLPFSRNPDHLSWKPLEVNVQSPSFSFTQYLYLQSRLRQSITPSPSIQGAHAEHKEHLGDQDKTWVPIPRPWQQCPWVTNIHLSTVRCVIVFSFVLPCVNEMYFS